MLVNKDCPVHKGAAGPRPVDRGGADYRLILILRILLILVFIFQYFDIYIADINIYIADIDIDTRALQVPGRWTEVVLILD